MTREERAWWRTLAGLTFAILGVSAAFYTSGYPFASGSLFGVAVAVVVLATVGNLRGTGEEDGP